jgi:hypothetical protein
MSTRRIARLEALLARVRARAGAPRRARLESRVEIVSERRSAAEARREPEEDPASLPTQPPPARPPPAAVGSEPELLQSDGEISVDVDMIEPAREAVIEGYGAPRPAVSVSGGAAPEEPPAADRYESRERLVAAEPVLPDLIADSPGPEEVTVVAAPMRESELLAADAVEPVAEVTDEEIEEEMEEEAPSSSRRVVEPVPEERLAEMAFGAGEAPPPRHTPPPESGRLPAAPVVEFDADVTGVRDASPVASVIDGAGAAAPAVVRELTPQVVRPEIASGEPVDVLGAAQRFAPGTFVELLDASLAL